MTRIKAKFTDLAGKKITKFFNGLDFASAEIKMAQFTEDRKDVILDDYEEA